MNEKDEEKAEEYREEEEAEKEEAIVVDTTSASAAFILGTSILGWDADMGKEFVKIIKRPKKKKENRKE